MPTTSEEAYQLSDAILKLSDEKGEEEHYFEWGNVIQWPQNLVKSGYWTPVQWYAEELANAAYEIENSAYLEPVGLRHRIGPAGVRISEAFKKSSEDQAGSKKIFWSISSKIRKQMLGTPDAWYCAKQKYLHRAQNYWRQRSQVLVAVRYDTLNSRLTSMWSKDASVGTGWIPVSIDSERQGKALVAWWNSTPAMLMLLNRRSRKLTYPKWSLKQLRSVAIPKPDNPAWGLLAQAWEKVSEHEMLPLHSAENCVVRKEIDKAAAKALGVQESQIAEWRSRLAMEPTISKKPAPFD